MSVRTITRVWEYSHQSSTDLLLLLAIADHADDDGVCWPGISRLAKKTRISERQTIRNVEKLARRGEIFLSRQCGRGHSNLYFITAGLSQDEIEQTLRGRFELGEEAVKLANSITGLLKGDTDDTIYDKKKVTSSTLKGDIQYKKVTSSTLKGDTAVSPEPSIETSFKPSIETIAPFEPLTIAIATICKFNLETIARPTQKELVKVQGIFSKQNISPTQVLEFEEWRTQHHWSKSTAPTLKQLCEYWGQYEAWIKLGRPAPISQNGASSNGHKPTYRTGLDLEAEPTVNIYEDQPLAVPPGD